MFFSKYIKSVPRFNKIVISVINASLILFKLFSLNKRSANENIAVIALHKLGDSIFTFEAIKNIINYHQKNIFIICFEETTPIFKIAFDSINFIELNHDDFSFSDRIARRRAKKILKELNPSTVYDFTGNITSASLLIRCNAEKIIGINEPYYRSLYTKFTPIRTVPHIIDKYLDAVRSSIPVSSLNTNEIKENSTGDYILIHPFAGTKSKEWSLRKFLSLAKELNERYKCVIVTEPNKINADVLREIMEMDIKFVETNTTAELIEVTKRCFLFIGNDSGPIHIANLLGKPTFTIYGPTNPDFHKPLNGINNYIIREIPCSPGQNEKMCFTYGGMIGCPSFECMNNLALSEVRKSINEFINFIEKRN